MPGDPGESLFREFYAILPADFIDHPDRIKGILQVLVIDLLVSDQF